MARTVQKVTKKVTEQVKESGRRQLHRSNCNNKIRKIYINKFGEQISLVGRYSFDWSVIITDHVNKTKIRTFSSREEALKEFKMIVKIYN